jgi:hypothetical protein
MAGDPAVRWQVQRDLLGLPEEVVKATREEVATTGWGGRLLAEQAPDGTWGEGLYSPKWTSTTYTLLLLRQLGLPGDHPQAHAGCERLLDGATWVGGGLTYGQSSRTLPEACITSIVLSIVAAFDRVDERAESALSWLLDQQLVDGGWNCRTVRDGSAHGSFNTSILALEALELWRSQRAEDPVLEHAAGEGRRFFLEHRLYCSHRTGETVHERYTRSVFPPGWHHDLLRGLDYFQAVGAVTDDRLGDAIDLLRSKEKTDGTWSAYRPYSGKYWFRLETPGKPSRINTLRALRVLRWWEWAR